MGLWRKLVTVLAGTMFAAGGILGVVAVLEPTTTAPGGPGTPTTSLAFNVPSASTAVSGDLGTVGTWLDSTASAPNVSADDKLQAAVALDAVAYAGGMPPYPGSQGAATLPTSPLENQAPAADSAFTNDSTTVVRANAASTASPNVTFSTELTALVVASGAVFSFDANGYDGSGWTNPSAPPVLTAAEAQAEAQGAPSDLLSVRAAVPQAAPEYSNATAAARAEIEARFTSGALEGDTLNQSLASQALRAQYPAQADAINAELRFRQQPDGSFGGIRETAEAVRALAVGTPQDVQASARALDYLDSLGPLPSDQAVWRLRAHGVSSSIVSDERAMPPPAASGGLAAGGAAAQAMGQNKGLFAGLFIMGGIGLSLALVTVDALKGARRQLYDMIKRNPGLHVNELRRRLTMSPSSIEYHLSVLVGAGLVVSEEDGRYKRYYANGAGLGLNTRSPNSRNTLGALRRPHASEIVQHLMERDPGATAREVSRALALHESAASRRMAHLERSGVLESTREGRERRYRIRDRPAAVKALSLVEVPPPPASEVAPPMVSAEQRPTTEGTPAAASGSP